MNSTISIERIRALSPQQKTLLLERLGNAGETSAAEREIIAYVVRRAGESPCANNATQSLTPSPRLSGERGFKSKTLIPPLPDPLLTRGRKRGEQGQYGDASAGNLRSALASQLPDFMIPTHFIFLDALPLNPNGKVDRNALPAPQPMPVIAATGEMLRNETEIQLTTIWAEVLKLDHVGVDANFFQLGGHSLLALQLMMRVREAFAADLPLKALFDHPTVAGLAEVIKNFSAGPSTSKRRITPHRTSATANPMQRSLQEI